MMMARSNQPSQHSGYRMVHRPGARIDGAAIGELPEQDIDPAAELRATLIFEISNELSLQRRNGGLPADIALLERRLAAVRRGSA